MAKQLTTAHHRPAAPAPSGATTPARPTGTVHATAAPKRVQLLAPISKTVVIARVAQRSGKSVQETSMLVNATLETIREALKGGDEVRLTGFGSFGVRTRAAHTGVNPQTRAKIRVPAKQRVRFSAGKGLSDAVAR